MQQNLFVRTLFVVLAILVGLIAFAQPSLERMQRKLASEKQNSKQSFYKFELNSKIPTQAGIFFSPDMAVQKTNLLPWLADKLTLRQGTDAFLQSEEPTNYEGSKVSKLKQYYKGIRVEHGVISEVDIDSKVRLLQMEFYSVPGNMATVPVITEATALENALKHVGAERYVWEDYTGNDADYAFPHGELVIVEDSYQDLGKLCLAYKFNIYASKPLGRNHVYVNALNGKVVFVNAVIKHLDKNNEPKSVKRVAGLQKQSSFLLPPSSPVIALRDVQKQVPNSKPVFELASGYTKYSGDQVFITQQVDPNKYRLWGATTANNTPYFVVNANHAIIPIPDASLTDFTDANNIWDETSYIDDTTYAALDIQWGVDQVLSYWWDVHNRKSYDANNADIKNVFHYGVKYKGAFWNGTGMFYGDGTQDANEWDAATSIDVISHELGHAVCDNTAGLLYKRESGALNEGFSDIWAACIDHYINKNFTALTKVPFRVGDEIIQSADVDYCIRDMKDPLRKGLAAPIRVQVAQPDTYKDVNNFWFDTNVENCPVPLNSDDPFGNDYCGVHKNSSVLNKWFYLLVTGDAGTNSQGYSYDIDPMGFEKAEKIAFYTEMILTPNSGFEAAKNASINAVLILAASPNTLGITEADIININKAWNAVGVRTDTLYNMANTPVFASNQFTSVAIGQRGYIWAGTSNNGLYKYNGKSWQKSTTLTNHNIAQILPDRDGGIWIAQFGRTGAQANFGGIGHYRDTSFIYQQFSESEGLPTRNVRGIYVNNNLGLFSAQKFKRIWGACFSDITVGVARPGAVVFGKENPVAPIYFNKQKNGVNQSNGFCVVIGGNKNEVWVFASSNSTAGAGQILRYRTADSVYLGFIDNTNQPAFDAGYNIKAMYYDDVKRRWWFGLTTGGMVVLDSATNNWSKINFSSVFPTGTIINTNAITGDTRGNIYIGTNKGFVFFGSPNASTITNPLTESQYSLYTMADGLPANNVRGIAIDYRVGRIILATDSGIVFKNTLCKECINTGPVYSKIPGDWSNPGVWEDGVVPGIGALVVIKHAVVISQNANCKSVKVEGGGKLTVNTGVTLMVEGETYLSNEPGR